MWAWIGFATLAVVKHALAAPQAIVSDPGFSTKDFGCLVAQEILKDKDKFWLKPKDAIRARIEKFNSSGIKISGLGAEWVTGLANKIYRPADASMDEIVLSAHLGDPPKFSSELYPFANANSLMAYQISRFDGPEMMAACYSPSTSIKTQKNKINSPSFLQEFLDFKSKLGPLEGLNMLAAFGSDGRALNLPSLGRLSGGVIEDLLRKSFESLDSTALFQLSLTRTKDPLVAIALLSRLFREDVASNRCKLRNAVLASKAKPLFVEPLKDQLGAVYHFWGYLLIGLVHELGAQECYFFGPKMMSFGYECIVQALDWDDYDSDSLALGLAQQIAENVNDPSKCGKR